MRWEERERRIDTGIDRQATIDALATFATERQPTLQPQQLRRGIGRAAPLV
jgi:hypothetical protein